MIIFSYINPSIKRKISNFFRSSHSNFFEANTILNSLKKTGLKISSFDHDSSIDIDYKKITHVFGYGNPVFQVISKSLNREIKFIHYLTGSEKIIKIRQKLKELIILIINILPNINHAELLMNLILLKSFILKKLF